MNRRDTQAVVRVGSLLLALFSLGSAEGRPADALAPRWEALLDAGGAKIRLVLHVQAQDGGGWRATLDSPDQGAHGLPIETVTLDGSRLRLGLPRLAASFEGVLNKTRDEMAGTWTQGGRSMPLTFEAAAGAPVRRPQVPKPPLPYDALEVTFPSQAKDVTLAGTLTLPRGGTSLPAVVLITGSGPEDRDETIFGHKPFLVLADHLTRAGCAVLRFDDRGVGGSSAGPPTATSLDFAEDALGAVRFLAGRADIDPKGIGLLGHSEGGLIAAIAAAKSPEVAFVIMMAGPGLPGDRLLELQTEAVARSAGAPAAQVATVVALNRQLYAAVRENPDDHAAEARIRQLLDGKMPPPAIDRQVKTLLLPWMRFFLTHDPATDLARVRVPVLALNGEKDVQVVAGPNLDGIRQALEAAHHEDHAVRQLQGLNHLMQECSTGAVGEYATIEQTMSPRALLAISEWIAAHTRLGSRGTPSGRK